MKALVTGVNGQLGHDVMLELARRGVSAIGSGSTDACRCTDAVADMAYFQLDITNREAVMACVSELWPDVVFHCSAWTAVDDAEKPENRERVFALNEQGPENLAVACERVGAKLVYISTDYVFDGGGTVPWTPEEQSFSPLNVYGASKLAGERAVLSGTERHFIVRTSWVFGSNGNNFVKTMLRVGKSRDDVRVVDDQIGTPTYTADLARLLADMAETERYGIYHAANSGGCISWADFAGEIFKQAGLATAVIPVTTEEYGASLAARPRNSRLDMTKLAETGFLPLPDWRDALHRFLTEIGEDGSWDRSR